MSDIAMPPTPPPAETNPLVVEARYVPKSVTIKDETDGSLRVTIASKSILAYAVGLLVIPFFFFVLPLLALIGAGTPAFIVLVLPIGLAIFLAVKGGPTMTINRAGISVNGMHYRIEDAAGFRAGADDAWLIQLYEKFGLSPLALQYGIYAVKLPYLLPKLETAKVASYLTMRLKHIVADLGKDRERKIQQAQEF